MGLPILLFGESMRGHTQYDDVEIHDGSYGNILWYLMLDGVFFNDEHQSRQHCFCPIIQSLAFSPTKVHSI